MIKEEKKNREKNKTVMQVCSEYLRTVMLSLAAAFVITVLLSVHARNEMIKNLQAVKNKPSIDERIAKQLIQQTDLTKELLTKKYEICMHVGNLYESAHDYPNAEFAYRLALAKAKSGNFQPYYHLVNVLVEQEKFEDAIQLVDSIKDYQNKNLIKFKTRAYIVIGDKYYSIQKFLKAARAYEKAKYYYSKFTRNDKVIVDSINTRLFKSYSNAGDIIIKQGYNSYGVKYLKKALEFSPDNDDINYKLAIIYTDYDPETAVKIFEKLQEKIPQYIDYDVYNRALMKSANIADLDGRKAVAKY